MNTNPDNNTACDKIKANRWRTGMVERIYDYEADDMPLIGLACSEEQARLIRRLCGSMSLVALRERGFTDEEGRALQHMHSTI